MARFLITSWPLPGHLYPQIAIAHALRARGHECAFYTGNYAARVLADEGFHHFPFQDLDEQGVIQVVFSPDHGTPYLGGVLQFQNTLRKWLLGTLPQQVTDLERVIAAWRPAVIASDPTMWSPFLVLREKYGLPVAVSSFVPACIVPGPDAPPFGLGLPRPKDWHTRLLARLVTWGTDVMTLRFRREATALRRRYGLAPLRVSVSAHTGTMPLYLVPSAPEFDYQRHDLPPSVHYVGPCLWNRPRHEPPAEWLAGVSRQRPWVHVTEGTVHVGEPFVLRAAARGLAGLPMEVIMTTGGDRDPADLGLGPPAPNIHIGRWVSHSELLPRTSVVITTGGAGSVLAALNAGVPLIIVPTEWDKPEIAQRVVEAGAGLRVAPRRCTPRRLCASVERVLGDPSFRKNAQNLSRIFAGYGGAARAAELLEDLARTSEISPIPKPGKGLSCSCS